jgi:hypothetical protein
MWQRPKQGECGSSRCRAAARTKGEEAGTSLELFQPRVQGEANARAIGTDSHTFGGTTPPFLDAGTCRPWLAYSLDLNSRACSSVWKDRFPPVKTSRMTITFSKATCNQEHRCYYCVLIRQSCLVKADATKPDALD